jgi:hypothetical protein
MDGEISHNRNEETPEAKARWFQSLPMNERMDLLCEFTDMILQLNPRILETKDAEPIKGRIQVIRAV